MTPKDIRDLINNGDVPSFAAIEDQKVKAALLARKQGQA